MNRYELIDSGPVPGSDSVMQLFRRGDELVIHVDGRPLMSTREHGSEDALAELALARLKGCEAPRVLVGGLGIGFTLAAALRGVGAGTVTVAELVPAVIRWNRGPLGEAAGRPLDDPRATLHEGDVAELIRRSRGWDAVLLDVDNGPDALSRASNAWLYGWQGLEALHAAIRPGGVLGVWSAAPDAAFTRRLGRAGFVAEPLTVRSRGAKYGRRHVVWIGVRRQR